MNNYPIVSPLCQSRWDLFVLKLGLPIMKFKLMEQSAQKSCVSVIVLVSLGSHSLQALPSS